LGITDIKLLNKCKFDTVDSNSWKISVIFGYGHGKKYIDLKKEAKFEILKINLNIHIKKYIQNGHSVY
jgi:hypothetical protein